MDDQRSLQDQLLGDMSYDAPQPKPQTSGADPRLAGASAVVLDDMGGQDAPPVRPASRYQSLTPEQIAVLQQQRAAKGEPPYTNEEIAELNAEFIERQRLQFQQQALQQQQAPASASVVLEEATYEAPEKKQAATILPEVKADDLLEETQPEPERKPSFNQADIEEAKRQATKRMTESLTEAPTTDPKEAQRQLRELRAQQAADRARAGFPISVILTVIGVLAGGFMVTFASRPYAEGFDPNLFFRIADSFYRYGGIVLIILAVTIVLRVKQVRGLTSFLFGLGAVLLLIPGIVLLFEKRHAGGFVLSLISYLIAVIGSLAVTAVMSASENLSAYYKREDVMYD